MGNMPFIGSRLEGVKGEMALIGVPFDGTASYRAGARFGPGAIREGSQSLEMYSAFVNVDLDEVSYIDRGDLEVPPGNAQRIVEIVEEEIGRVLADGLRPVVLGGEHTITLGVIRALAGIYDDLTVLQLDAHADMRDEYRGEALTHATIMRRVQEIIPPERIIRFGIRSGTREELQMAGVSLPITGRRDIEGLIKSIGVNVPLYVTIDMDVFDPSLVPGVGNPEPGGLTYREFIQLVRGLSYRRIVGFDVMELAPQYDHSNVSAIVAASVVKELLLSM